MPMFILSQHLPALLIWFRFFFQSRKVSVSQLAHWLVYRRLSHLASSDRLLLAFMYLCLHWPFLIPTARSIQQPEIHIYVSLFLLRIIILVACNSVSRSILTEIMLVSNDQSYGTNNHVLFFGPARITLGTWSGQFSGHQSLWVLY